MPWRARSWLAVALLLLGGCEPELLVSLAPGDQHTPAPVFSVREPSGEAVRFETVRVYEGPSLRWHLVATVGGDAGVAALTYGVVPPGFSEVVPAVPLQPGREYVLVVSGRGQGQARFVVAADGVVQAKGK